MPADTRADQRGPTVARVCMLALVGYVGTGGTGPWLARSVNAVLWVGIVIAAYTAARVVDRRVRQRGWPLVVSLALGLVIAAGGLLLPMLGTPQFLSN